VSLPVVAVTDTKVFLRRALGAAWRRVRAVSPGPIEIGPPICQLFIGGYGKRTVYTFVNFPSLFSPTTASACSYRLTLYDQGGNKVGSRRIGVPALGTVEVRVEDIFDLPLPEIGLVSAQITSGSALSYGARHLGPIRAHFYAMYHDEDMRSIAIVHPQSAMWEHSPAPESWRSSLIICPRKLKAVELFQINPTATAVQTEISICNLNDDRLASSSAQMPSRSARRISWLASDFTAHEHVVIASQSLPAPNAKPLLFQHHNGGFSASHS
jgi:hypothetical protein